MSKFIQNSEMKFVSKTWGHEIWIWNDEKYCGKILFIRKGEWLSYHFHKIKDEVLYVQSGKMRFVISENESGSDPIERIMSPGEAYHVTVHCPHQMEALEDTFVYEVSTQHFDSDSYRLSPSKGDGGDRVTGRQL